MKNLLITKKVSIIVPVFNAAEYLDRCVTSLLVQDYQNFEIILIDDASTDASAAICKTWAARDARIKTFFQRKNKGPSATRNVGLAHADGEFVCFVDSDDWCEGDYLSQFIQVMDDNHVDMVCVGFYSDKFDFRQLLDIHSEGMRSKNQLIHDIIKFHGDIQGFLWNKCYRMSLIRAINLSFDESVHFMEDELFNIKYVLAADRFYYRSTPLYHYANRPDSIVHTPSAKKIQQQFYSLKLIMVELLAPRKTKQLPMETDPEHNEEN